VNIYPLTAQQAALVARVPRLDVTVARAQRQAQQRAVGWCSSRRACFSLMPGLPRRPGRSSSPTTRPDR
jgi:hypothetical protein